MDWEMIERAANALDEMPEAILKIADSYNQRPSPESQASREFGNCPNSEALKMAYAQGLDQVFLVSVDHMLALRRTLTPSPKALSCASWTCARAVLESCANAIWLFDLTIDWKERLTRSLNYRYENLDEQKKFFREYQKQLSRRPDREQVTSLLSQSENGIKLTEEGIKYHKKVAKDLGIAEKKDKNGKFLGFGSGKPSISNRITSTLNAKDSYALLSGVAHGMQWATLHLSVKIEPFETDWFISPELTPTNALSQIQGVVAWFAQASWDCFRLLGWDLEKLKSILEQECNRVEVNEELRFWRGDGLRRS